MEPGFHPNLSRIVVSVFCRDESEKCSHTVPKAVDGSIHITLTRNGIMFTSTV